MLSENSKIKLELVQTKGIVKLLCTKCNLDALELAIEEVTGINEIRDAKKSLKRLNRKNLIEIIGKFPTITDVDIEELYEKHRYGLKPGFTISYFEGECTPLRIEQLHEKVDAEIEQLTYEEDANYKNIYCKAIEQIVDDTIEVSFTYLSKHPYISEEDKPSYVYELKETFVWINTEEMYLAIKNAPSYIQTTLKNVFRRIYDKNINSVRITGKMIDTIFKDNAMKKGSFYKPDANSEEPQKVTIADDNLQDKPNVKKNYEGYSLTSSSLLENINEEETSTLGINCKSGKIYLTRNLNSTDFRNWSIKRIKDIIRYIKDAVLEDFETFKTKNVMDNPIWDKYTKPQKEVIEHIIFAMYCAKKNGLEAYHVSADIGQVLKICYGSFYPRFAFSCDECGEETTIASCPFCGDTKLTISKGGILTCSSCAEQQENNFQFECDNGHIKQFSGVGDFLHLIPKPDLLESIAIVLKNNLSIEFDSEKESFLLEGENLFLTKQPIGRLVSIGDISTFRDILSVSLDVREKQKLLDRFDKIKEKCRKHGSKACGECKDYRDRFCMMKLFTVFSFRPSPHQNNEFGDFNFKVEYKGSECGIVGVAKSRTSNDTLTLSSGTSREILQQVLTMSRDRRVEIIAVTCPMRFHPQLEKELEYLCKITGKDIVIFDDEFMLKLLWYYDDRVMKPGISHDPENI